MAKEYKDLIVGLDIGTAKIMVVVGEVLAGEKAFNQTGNWLPDATVDACRDYLVSIKGPLTTPVGGGIRSLNVALRQELDLYVCLRPVRYFTGVPSPVIWVSLRWATVWVGRGRDMNPPAGNEGRGKPRRSSG